jgi:hypothetical protein
MLVGEEEIVRRLTHMLSFCPMTEEEIMNVWNTQQLASAKREIDNDAKASGAVKRLIFELYELAMDGTVRWLVEEHNLSGVKISSLLGCSLGSASHHRMKARWGIKSDRCIFGVWSVDDRGELMRKAG